MEIHFAPMQGYADHAYRRLHAAIYGGVDCYYTPFIRLEKGAARRQDMARLRESIGDGTRLVPQVIFNSVGELEALAAAVKDLGFERIDLNLGCPYPMQTDKGRGAAMIANAKAMEQVASFIEADTASYSIKMRLGMADPAEWQALMPTLNGLSLTHIAMHPRIAKQHYAGELHEAQFASFAAQSRNPAIWNGEVRTAADIDRIAGAYPALKGIMIGRGMLARPSLAAEWREGKEWPREKRIASLLRFHDELFDYYQSTLCGPTQILQKIKPFWEYLEPEIGHRAHKAVRKATTLDRYKTAVMAAEQS